MALAAELRKKFTNGDVPLDQRVIAAKNLFVSNEFSFVRGREELVLNWLLSECHGDHCHVFAVFSALRDCLRSDHMSKLKILDIRTATKESFIKILIDALNQESCKKLLTEKPKKNSSPNESIEHSEVHSVIHECALLSLETDLFLFYFRNNIDKYVELSVLMLNYAAEVHDVQVALRYINSLIRFQSISLKKEEIFKVFIEDLLIIIIDFYKSMQTFDHNGYSKFQVSKFGTSESTNNLKEEILHLIRFIVFPYSIHKELFLNLCSLIDHGHVSSSSVYVLFKFLIKISSERIAVCEKNISSVYTFIFESFVSSFPNNFSAHYKLFVVLCLFVGFQPDIEGKGIKGGRFILESEKVSSSLNCKLCTPDNEFSNTILKEMIAILPNIYINIEEQVKNVSFKLWMQSLIVYLMSTKHSHFLCDIIVSVIEINPLIVEPIVSTILKFNLLQKKETDEEKESYRRLFIRLLNMFIKLHKVDEFIFYHFLPTLKAYIEECRKKSKLKSLDIPVSDVIAEGFRNIFREAVEMLTGDLWNIFLKKLKNLILEDIVHPLKHGEFDMGHHLYLSVLEYLLVEFLGGVRIAEQSVLQQICVQFVDFFLDLRISIGKMGIAAIQQKLGAAAHVLACFLRLSHCVGEMQLLLLIYSPWCSQQSDLLANTSKESSCPTDLSYLHTFLSSEQWKDVSKNVKRLGDSECQEAWNALLEQKLRAWIIFGSVNKTEIQSALSSELIKHLLHSENKSWEVIFDKLLKVPQLSDLLPPEKLLAIAEYCLENVRPLTLSSNTINLLQNPMMCETLLIALGWASLKKIGTMLAVPNDFRTLKHEDKTYVLLVNETLESFNFSKIISGEMSLSGFKKRFSFLGEKLNIACADLFTRKNLGDTTAHIDLKAVHRYIVLLSKIPLTFLSPAVKVVFAFVKLAILLVIQDLLIYSKNQEKMSGIKKECNQDYVILIKMRDTCLQTLEGFLEETQILHLVGDMVDTCLFVQLLLYECKYSKPQLQFLFKLGLSKMDSVAELAKAASTCDSYLEEKFNHHNSLTCLVLLEAMRKQGSSGSGEIHSQFKEVTDTLQNEIFNRISKRMKSEKMTESSIVPFMETLSCVLSLPHKSAMMEPYINNIVTCAISVMMRKHSSRENILKAEALLTSIMKNFMFSGSEACKKIVQKAFIKLSSTSPSFVNILKYATKKDSERILKKLKSDAKLVSQGRIKDFPRTDLALALVQIDEPISVPTEPMLIHVCSAVSTKILRDGYSDKLTDFTNLLLVVVQNRKIPLPPTVADVILTTILCFMEEQPNSINHVLTVTPIALELLKWMVLHHSIVLKDRIPAFIMAFKSIFHALVVNCTIDNNLGLEDCVKLSECTLEFEQLTKALIDNIPRAFKAVSQFIMADLLLELEQVAVDQKFKIHIMNSLYVFIGLCDTFSISHLYQALPPASMELFKFAMSNYKKFHRYSGKV